MVDFFLCYTIEPVLSEPVMFLLVLEPAYKLCLIYLYLTVWYKVLLEEPFFPFSALRDNLRCCGHKWHRHLEDINVKRQLAHKLFQPLHVNALYLYEMENISLTLGACKNITAAETNPINTEVMIMTLSKTWEAALHWSCHSMTCCQDGSVSSDVVSFL